MFHIFVCTFVRTFQNTALNDSREAHVPQRKIYESEVRPFPEAGKDCILLQRASFLLHQLLDSTPTLIYIPQDTHRHQNTQVQK